MSGYVQILGECFACHRLFTFNPHRVPSVRDPSTGEREPICRDCMSRANALRRERGEKPHPIHADAYEAIPAEEF